MRKSSGILLLLIFQTINVFAQVGGEHVYDFLNLCSSARVAALGGEQVALGDADASMVFHNPSVLNPEMDETIVLNYVSYMAGVNFGYVSYARDLKRWGTWSAGVHYINYGDFVRANSFGQITGDFKASEYAVLISGSKTIYKKFKFAATFKYISSNLEKYNSYGLATDLGISYQSTDRSLMASFVARNMGVQVQPYYGSNREDLPFQLVVGVSKKLAHAPFRLSATYRHLQKFNMGDILQENISSDLLSEDEVSKDDFLDKSLKHLVLGVEFFPTKNLILRAGYNFQRRYDLKIEEKRSTVGFSWGFGFKVYRFQLSYASARYHLAGTSNNFSISTRLSDFNFN